MADGTTYKKIRSVAPEDFGRVTTLGLTDEGQEAKLILGSAFILTAAEILAHARTQLEAMDKRKDVPLPPELEGWIGRFPGGPVTIDDLRAGRVSAIGSWTDPETGQQYYPLWQYAGAPGELGRTRPPLDSDRWQTSGKALLKFLQDLELAGPEGEVLPGVVASAPYLTPGTRQPAQPVEFANAEILLAFRILADARLLEDGVGGMVAFLRLHRGGQRKSDEWLTYKSHLEYAGLCIEGEAELGESVAPWEA